MLFYYPKPLFTSLKCSIMPVNSKKQGQGQTGKKGDDSKTKAAKESRKENKSGSVKEPAQSSRIAKK